MTDHNHDDAGLMADEADGNGREFEDLLTPLLAKNVA